MLKNQLTNNECLDTSLGSSQETLSCLTDTEKECNSFVGFSDNETFEIMKYRVNSCSTEYVKFKKICNYCGHDEIDKEFWITCGNRYCKKCYGIRYSKVKKRIFNNYRKYFHKRCVHLVFTLPRGFYTKKKKRLFEYHIYRFFLKLRKKGYRTIGIKGMDLTLKNDNDVYLHSHSALRIEFQLNKINKQLMRDIWRKVTNNKKAVLKIKYSSTNSTLTYLAKRCSGLISHDNKFLSDYLSLEQYFTLFYRSRYITPIGISCNIAPNFKRDTCSNCKISSDFFISLEVIEKIEINPQQTLGVP